MSRSARSPGSPFLGRRPDPRTAAPDRTLSSYFEREGDFIIYDVVGGREEPFFESLGFHRNTGMINYIIDHRPYVSKG